MAVGADADQVQRMSTQRFNGVKLAQLTRLDYDTYRAHDGLGGGQMHYVRLNIDTDGDGAQDDQCFFEPTYLQYCPTGLDPTATGVWQTWHALQGCWWCNNGFATATPGSGVKPWSVLVAAAPNGQLLPTGADINSQFPLGSMRIDTGGGAGSWDNFVGYVDKVVVGVSGVDTTFNFEP
jgi:hypothetical protein